MNYSDYEKLQEYKEIMIETIKNSFKNEKLSFLQNLPMCRMFIYKDKNDKINITENIQDSELLFETMNRITTTLINGTGNEMIGTFTFYPKEKHMVFVTESMFNNEVENTELPYEGCIENKTTMKVLNNDLHLN